MTHIHLQGASVEFPVFDVSSRSIKNQLLAIVAGGNLSDSSQGKILIRALDNISLELHAGDRLGVIGSNGSGKSTFLRLLSGVYNPTSGSISRVGSVASLVDIGLGINPDATGRENIVLRGLLLGMSSKEIDRSLDEIIAFTELGNYIELPVRTYSTGMLMRLAVSVATAVQSDILVMDEWLSVGDARFINQVRLRLEAMVEKSKIFVLASHDMDLVVSTTTKTLWLENGKVKDFGDSDKVVRRYSLSN